MNCKYVALALSIAGCAEDPATVISIDGRASMIVELVPAEKLNQELQGAGSYRWDVAEAPEGSSVPDPEGDAPSAKLFPDRRGVYLVERWFVFGLGEDLTHRFVVNVQGARPFASATTETNTVAINTSVVVDGGASWSPEARSVTHHWRLAMRPMGSTATLADRATQTELVPDVAGDYVIELAVFDGELWSEMPAVLSVSAN